MCRSTFLVMALAALGARTANAQSVVAQAETASQPAGSRVEEAQRHIAMAMTAFRAHDYQTAIHEFELAHAAVPNPDLWYNLARSRELSGDPEGAAADYRRYLRDKVDPPDRAEVERHVTQLIQLVEHQAAARRMRAEGSRLRVQIEGAPRGAHVFVDEQELAASAVTEAMRVAPGEHTVRVTADGAQAWSARVRVRQGETVTVFSTLAPETRYVTRPAPHIASAVLGGLGLASVGVAGYFGTRAAFAECEGCAAQIRASNNSDIALGVGAALVVGAVVAFFIERASGTTVRISGALP